MAPAAGAAPRDSVIVLLDAEQFAPLTETGDPLIRAVKSEGLTVPHISGSLNVALTELLPGVAEIETKVGAVVSTVTVRVIVGDDLPLLSIARKAMLCGPSGSGAVGLNVQLAEGVPQAEQLTPSVENAALSTLASTRAMTALLDWAVPE